jgi:hypothetical protein
VDLYRVWAPARQVLRANVIGSVTVRVLQRAARPAKAQPLAVGKHGVAAYRNASRQGAYVYVEIRPAAGARSVAYNLRLTAARR